MSVQDCFFVVAWVICGGLLVCLFKQNRRLQLELMTQYAFEQLSQVYFCSYSLLDVYLLRFFPRYREFVDWGFCAPVAAMSMLALKNHPTAHYVYARAGKDRYRHCWVEFRYSGTWYVIDACCAIRSLSRAALIIGKISPKLSRFALTSNFGATRFLTNSMRKCKSPKPLGYFAN